MRSRLVTASLIAVLASMCEARTQRDPAQVRAFRAEHPCPSTGLKRGACPGWDVDHIVPLCAGGLDHPSNLQWLAKDDHRWKTFIDVRECRKARNVHRSEQNEKNE